MRLAVFGSGYVGLVTAACFAEVGNHVVVVDIDEKKIGALKVGKSPIYEPQLESLLQHNLTAKRLQFTTDAKEAIMHAEIIFIAVGTPPKEDGSADMRHVLAVAKTIGEYIPDYRVIVNKSTVLVGAADEVKAVIVEEIKKRRLQIECDVVSNPEFLKEGSAINDCMRPDRIVVGSDSERAIQMMRALYAPFNRNHDRMLVMDIRSAELTKYAANAMLAAKISFMNEMSRIAEKVGADIEHVRLGIGADQRIGYHFIYAGCGYGGSCFPKDVQALIHTAKINHYDAKIISAVHAVNEAQKHVLFEKIDRHFKGDLKGKNIAVWGLSFKPNTDDIREASSRRLIEALWQNGASVRVYDPEALTNFVNEYGKRDDLIPCAHSDEALAGADALVVVTEWSEFKSPDFDLIKQKLESPVIFDGRNLYDPVYLKTLGFHYYAIGRQV